MVDASHPSEDPAQAGITITLSAETLDKLRQQVTFRTAGDVRALVADALNSYIQLGSLHAQGAEFLVRQGEDGKLTRMRFPFDADAQTGAQSDAGEDA